MNPEPEMVHSVKYFDQGFVNVSSEIVQKHSIDDFQQYKSTDARNADKQTHTQHNSVSINSNIIYHTRVTHATHILTVNLRQTETYKKPRTNLG